MTVSCFHCGEPVPPGGDLAVEIGGRLRPMCCHGCAAVAGWITGQHLERFYQRRESTAARPDTRPAGWWRAYDRAPILERVSEALPDGRHRMPLLVANLRCAACSWLVETVLGRLPGVRSLYVNFATGRGELEWDPARTGLGAILRRADELGYPMEPAALALHGRQRRAQRAALRRLIVAGIGMMQVMVYAVGLYIGALQDMPPATRDFLRWAALLVATPVVFYSGRPFFEAARRQLMAGRPGMDVPVALALLIAWCASLVHTFAGGGEVYLDSAVMFVFFLGLSRHIEQRARAHATALGATRSGVLPALAVRIRDGGEETVGVHELAPGDRVLVAAGETVPADGLLAGGAAASVDESMLTGESLPLPRRPGERLLAGSIAVTGPLVMRVTAAGSATLLASIERELHQAAARYGERFEWLNRLASRFIAAVLLRGALTFAYWRMAEPAAALANTLAVLVVTCPCALALAAPVVIAAARQAARARHPAAGQRRVAGAAGLPAAGGGQDRHLDQWPVRRAVRRIAGRHGPSSGAGDLPRPGEPFPASSGQRLCCNRQRRAGR